MSIEARLSTVTDAPEVRSAILLSALDITRAIAKDGEGVLKRLRE